MDVRDQGGPHFVTLGMFVIDVFSFQTEAGQPIDRAVPPQASHSRRVS